MIILNTVKEKCKGVWKSVEREEKSTIDYVLRYTTSANTVKEMKTGKEKRDRLHKLEKNTEPMKIKRYIQITIPY